MPPKLAFLFPWFELSLGVIGSLAILRGPAGQGRVETQLGETALLVVREDGYRKRDLVVEMETARRS